MPEWVTQHRGITHKNQRVIVQRWPCETQSRQLQTTTQKKLWKTELNVGPVTVASSQMEEAKTKREAAATKETLPCMCGSVCTGGKKTGFLTSWWSVTATSLRKERVANCQRRQNVHSRFAASPEIQQNALVCSVPSAGNINVSSVLDLQGVGLLCWVLHCDTQMP